MKGKGVHDMYARKAASKVIVYNAYGRNLFHQNTIHFDYCDHILLQYFHLPFFLRSSRDL